MGFLFRIYRIFVQALCVPIFLSDFFKPETGKEYGLGFWKKLSLMFTMIRNNRKIVSGSTFIEHLTMATTILNLPKSLEGVIVECGTYKGVSATNLSLVCKIVGRQMEIFDSFEGLPEPSLEDHAHYILDTREIHTYTKGTWCGRLEEVKANISKYGVIDVCNFNKGYFDETPPHFKKKCAFVWLDVDYRSSLETCVKYLWPLMQDGASLYTHEAGHQEIASLFFSESWWQNNLNEEPPGLVGAGTGLGLKILSGSHFASSTGYTVKNPQKNQFEEVVQTGGLKVNFMSSLRLTSSSKSARNIPAEENASSANH